MLSVVKDPINSAGREERFLGISFCTVIESDTKHWWELDRVEIPAFPYNFLQINQLRWDEGISNALPLKLITFPTPFWLEAILERRFCASLQLILAARCCRLPTTVTCCCGHLHGIIYGTSCSPIMLGKFLKLCPEFLLRPQQDFPVRSCFSDFSQGGLLSAF